MHSKTPRTVLAKIVAEKLLGEPSSSEKWLKVLAAYLVETNRVNEVDLLLNDIAQELHVQGGQLTVEVESARPLDAVAKRDLIDFLVAKTGALKVWMHETVDSELVGGVIARTPDAELDVSIARSLRQLTASIT